MSSIIIPDLSGETVGGDWIVIPWSVAFWQHYYNEIILILLLIIIYLLSLFPFFEV